MDLREALWLIGGFAATIVVLWIVNLGSRHEFLYFRRKR